MALSAYCAKDENVAEEVIVYGKTWKDMSCA
jgi:hypothetical protein